MHRLVGRHVQGCAKDHRRVNRSIFGAICKYHSLICMLKSRQENIFGLISQVFSPLSSIFTCIQPVLSWGKHKAQAPCIFPYIPRPNRLIIWPAAVTPLITGLYLSLSRTCAQGRSLSSQLGLEGRGPELYGSGGSGVEWRGLERARPNIDICPYVAAATTVGFLDRPGKGEKSKEEDYILSLSHLEQPWPWQRKRTCIFMSNPNETI